MPKETDRCPSKVSAIVGCLGKKHEHQDTRRIGQHPAHAHSEPSRASQPLRSGTALLLLARRSLPARRSVAPPPPGRTSLATQAPLALGPLGRCSSAATRIGTLTKVGRIRALAQQQPAQESAR